MKCTMKCERCKRLSKITLDCTDAAGRWRLCPTCFFEIEADNAELREKSALRRAAA